ncbi:hypothetical protein GCM10023225_02770 [Kineococcus glutinatus]|uniref:Uncharacterized protein n=1 Tax=Kineococcus glutinatus TaxID=1070872 RepID=A0ABP9H713_9ACTN
MGRQGDQDARTDGRALARASTYLVGLQTAAVGGAVVGGLLLLVGVLLWMGSDTSYTTFRWGAALVVASGVMTMAWAGAAAIAFWVSSAFLAARQD